MVSNKLMNELYKALVSIENTKDCEEFLDDLCTKKEVEQMAQRLKAAKLLKEGKTYTEIINETDISSATLSRVSRCIQYGKGYNKILKNK